MVVNSATAVPRGYYARFARFLAGEGWSVVTYDYRGIGGSRPARLRGFRARMRDWAQLDAAGVIDWVDGRSASRVAVVGHSFGGQALGLLPQADRLAAALLVGAQSGYWRLWDGWRRLPVAALWHVLIPGLSRACGFFPARLLGMGENSPAGVAREWAEWGRRPRVRDRRRRRRPGRGLRAGALSAALVQLQRRHVRPAARGRGPAGLLLVRARGATRPDAAATSGSRAFGHWAFFRERFREPLWTEAAAWLREAV